MARSRPSGSSRNTSGTEVLAGARRKPSSRADTRPLRVAGTARGRTWCNYQICSTNSGYRHFMTEDLNKSVEGALKAFDAVKTMVDGFGKKLADVTPKLDAFDDVAF